MPYQVLKKEPDACAFWRKQVFATTACSAIALVASTNLTLASTSSAPPVSVNGSRVTIVGLERSNTVFVPVRGFFEKLGANVTSSGSSVVATRRGKELARMTIGSRTAMVNGSSQTLSVAPFMSSGTVMLPLRVISEAAGASVAYVAAPRAVNVTGSSGAGAGIAGAAVAGAAAATVAQAAAPPAATATDVASAAPVADTQTNQSAIPWWVWALLALLVLALIMWAVTRRKKEPVITTSSSVRRSEPTITTSTKGGSDPTINTRK